MADHVFFFFNLNMMCLTNGTTENVQIGNFQTLYRLNSCQNKKTGIMCHSGEGRGYLYMAPASHAVSKGSDGSNLSRASKKKKRDWFACLSSMGYYKPGLDGYVPGHICSCCATLC